jgi:uncharacterized protein (DUF1697 family)
MPSQSSSPSVRYVALLRGINVGGNKKVPMADLKKMMEKMGYKNVKTLLNSGNAMFDATEKSTAALKKAFEAQFEKTFGFDSHTIIVPIADIETLLKKNPFKGIKVTPATRLYVTFISEKPKSTLKIPYESDDKLYRILSVSDSYICSVLTVTDTKNTTDAMKILEKEYGKSLTTRNWNTVEKMVL